MLKYSNDETAKAADKFCPPPLFFPPTTSNQGKKSNHCDGKVLILSMLLADRAYREILTQKWAKIRYCF